MVFLWQAPRITGHKRNGVTMLIKDLIEELIDELATGPTPSDEDIKALCYALHSSMVRNNVPSLLWLSVSFEDMGDLMHKAMACVVHDEDEREEDAREKANRFRRMGAV